MHKKFFIGLTLLSICVPQGHILANTTDDGSNPWERIFPSTAQDSEDTDDSERRRSDPNVLRDLGALTGNDRPELEDDARDFRNLTGITATAVEEFVGVDTSKYVGYLDLFLGLFRKRKRDETPDGSNQPEQDGVLSDESGQDSGGADSIDASDVVGAAGAVNPILAEQALENQDFSGQGGGPLGFNPQVLRTSLTASELLGFQRQQLAVQLGGEGQALTAAKAQEATTAMEAVNTLSDEMQELQATQDVNKLAAKQRSLMAVLAQSQFSEQQQTRLALLQNNQSMFRLQELLENQAFKADVNQVVTNNAAFRAAAVFSGIYGSQGAATP